MQFRVSAIPHEPSGMVAIEIRPSCVPRRREKGEGRREKLKREKGEEKREKGKTIWQIFIPFFHFQTFFFIHYS